MFPLKNLQICHESLKTPLYIGILIVADLKKICH